MTDKEMKKLKTIGLAVTVAIIGFLLIISAVGFHEQGEIDFKMMMVRVFVGGSLCGLGGGICGNELE